MDGYGIGEVGMRARKRVNVTSLTMRPIVGLGASRGWQNYRGGDWCEQCVGEGCGEKKWKPSLRIGLRWWRHGDVVTN